MEKPIFMHESLNVYKKAREFARDADSICANWGRDHCIAEHFLRASESIVINIASGVAASSSESKTQRTDYALGSTAECAACLDTAEAWNVMPKEACHTEKGRLKGVYGMLWKLRQSWLTLELREYSRDVAPETIRQFSHEKLDVYNACINYIRGLEKFLGRTPPSNRFIRALDASATSIVLNIAEGNSRVSLAERHRFFRDADAATTKSAALLDLCHRPGLNAEADGAIVAAKLILCRVGAMLGGLLG